MTDSFDVVVVGGGPGGYVAAIRAAQLGMRTACVEKRATLGGTCLNVGCIPSKELLHSTHLFEQAQHGFAGRGIRVRGGVEVDLAAMMAGKDKVVRDLTKGIGFLFRKHKVEHVAGVGRIAGPGRVEVTPEGGETRTLEARNIVVATGSEPAGLPGIGIDEKRILSSTGALALEAVPARLAVIGGGYIGLEMAVVWSRLGAKVTVIEFLDRILPNMDGDVAKGMQRILKKKGFAFMLGHKVTGAKKGRAGVALSVEKLASGETATVEADAVLVAVGRRPYTAGLGLESVGIETDAQGRIGIDDRFRTSAEGVYAIGDVVRGPMLAHKAEDEGAVCAEIIAGQSGHIDYDAIPGVVYTWPEAAAVGQTEEALKEAGTEHAVGRFPFQANSRARCNGETEGFVKILADRRTDRVLGVHILGADAGTMIAEAALAMEFGASAEDIARTCHAHPTLNEAVKEAALAVDGRPIHV
ncbi:MAG: dihydrolipoyl dehydrogenase [Alphaproteobacteria bacterium]|nr:dihydrolipoyl dehydrogenase [Alphaproteobacteria bacterium]